MTQTCQVQRERGGYCHGVDNGARRRCRDDVGRSNGRMDAGRRFVLVRNQPTKGPCAANAQMKIRSDSREGVSAGDYGKTSAVDPF